MDRGKADQAARVDEILGRMVLGHRVKQRPIPVGREDTVPHGAEEDHFIAGRFSPR